ncbi:MULTISPECIES: NYN domain-containing protein [Gammaproteobacteria]|uniref:NYN domain-containing protein n=1 Tax=Gammaproteobacteria TaxID=1236 RepID=UPI001ADC9029|nr:MULTISPECIES: NYN domain-containing protein [Gammaproteobacteria]MBO9483272.1 NYN domain-containing protein [Salinisphaera sp. G21_0]WBA83150.1 NYN domain-containing protein [Endozoicomonas sp. GU-1]WBA86075.1 NYN domain-containing protein [Endozoicomonas sp. GU-1]
MAESNQKIALFIDADNAPARKIEKILSEMAKYGVVSIRRAYGNWKSHTIKGWEEQLHEYAIQPIQQFDLTKGKNATDMAMTIDAMDTLYTRNMDAFCIVSSDSDFTPLIMRLLSAGKVVYGFGERKAPSPFVNACSRFLYLDEPGDDPEKVAANDKKSGHELKADTKLMNLIRNAIDTEQDDDGWAYLGRIGAVIANQASFDPRNYGYKKLGDLIRAVDLFETQVMDNNQMSVRDKRRGNHIQNGGH